MNLSEALNAALPEMPNIQARQANFRLDPSVIARENVEEGKRVVVVHQRGTQNLYKLPPEQWAIIELFDGTRTCLDVSDAYFASTGVRYSEEEIREFAETFREAGLWYRSPQEKNIALMQKLQEERRKRVKRKSKHGDIAHIQFSAWDPDRFLTWAYRHFRWLYSRWFTILTLVGFAFMTYVFIDRWSEIGRDTLKYYTFTEKTAGDLAEFWLLFLVLGFFHESSHGLTAKHFGAQVHRMGLHFIYLTPAFFVDVTEAWVYASRWQRVITIIAGIWSELVFCAAASVVWWGTAPGTFAHEFAYKVILITGVAVIVVNLNPLIKLDGYYFFTELIDVPDIKERSTAYVSSTVKKYFWRLPVEVEYVPKRLRPLFVGYALLSGAYSYMLLFAVARFARNIFYSYNQEWAFVPATLLALLIFRSRIRTLVRFMKAVYLQKAEMLKRFFSGPRLALAVMLLIALLVAPIWRDTVSGRFIVEAQRTAMVRAEVPGTVQQVLVHEGQWVEKGAPVATLRNLRLESEAAWRRAELAKAQLNSTQAQLQQVNFGAAQQAATAAALETDITLQQERKLRLQSPISGTVTTPHPENLSGSYVVAGTLVAEVADTREVKARIYVPEYDLRDVGTGATASLLFDSLPSARQGRLQAIMPSSQEIAEGLMHQEDYKGIHAARFYAAEVVLANEDGMLHDGMAGTAKIFVKRRSIAEMAYRVAADFASRKVW